MTVIAKDIMVESFDTIDENAPIHEALNMMFKGRVRENGQKSSSLLVVDDWQQLTGVITMYDVLYHLRPDFLNHGIDADVLPWTGQLKTVVAQLTRKTVKKVMSRNVTGAGMEEHIMVVLDRMIKNRFRRLPVLKNGIPMGVIYLSDICYHILC